MSDHKICRIRELNDGFRTGKRPELGKIVLTVGIREAAAAWPLGVVGLHSIVQNFSAFTPDNDPHQEHDFGSFEYAGEKCFFKIDYYDKAMEYGSEDPADPAQTTRVLTIMLAEEY